MRPPVLVEVLTNTTTCVSTSLFCSSLKLHAGIHVHETSEQITLHVNQGKGASLVPDTVKLPYFRKEKQLKRIRGVAGLA